MPTKDTYLGGHDGSVCHYRTIGALPTIRGSIAPLWREVSKVVPETVRNPATTMPLAQMQCDLLGVTPGTSIYSIAACTDASCPSHQTQRLL